MIEDYLDIRTLTFVLCILSLAIFSSMLYILRKKHVFPGFLEWTLGYFFNGIGVILMGLREYIPSFFSIILANVFVILFYLFCVRGTLRFSNNKQNSWFDLISITIFTVSFLIFTYLKPSINIRIYIINIFSIIYCCRQILIIWKYIPNILQERIVPLLISFIIIVVWSIFRTILTILLESEINDFLNSGAIQGITFIVRIGSDLLISLFMISSNSQRFELELKNAQKEIRTLTGLLPICSYCKKIKDDKEEWTNLEHYISEHSEALFSHGICPECADKYYGTLLAKNRKKIN